MSRGDVGLKGAQESDLWLGRDLGHMLKDPRGGCSS